MSADRATNQRLGFHRWVASLKSGAPPAASVTNAPLSAPLPTASTAPPPQHEVSTATAPRAKHDDDATRVHHIPKEIIHRMRARAASESPKAPQDEQTCVFRAPPELLERAKRAQAQAESEPPSEVLAAPSHGLPAEHDFGETLEAKSGVSLRLQVHPPSMQPLEVPHAPDNPHEVAALLDDETDAAMGRPDADAPRESYVDGPALVSETPFNRLSEASLERLSEAPSFRQPLGGKLWVAALMVVVALLLVWSTR